ncbi:hypothetical protein [Stenotrophomonas maltophilia]|jgi:hypothetical protein|uniref:hypothetical protein n=2 Tax=Lysobacteraceae TaxID=32033 RepID=UPI00066E245E|nr:hypothetical protein [Stenotrophomonas maltophilia]ELC7364153.1 hypothetical protein [Stenotrophomonas maltophilia]ELF4107597.1 hypothetical protein [Stenotrophomonas maltophilia]ELF4111257.1 hypothetical protein [Stenotrophomonas maltophilia]MBA0249860.1 hypothetical protein [Stenotrophomonas maltophilia]MBA0318554.1 hypothetical protein [Stenotrophomonas maltophilia]
MPSAEAFELALSLLGKEDVDEGRAERDLVAAGIDAGFARRLLIWLPEAFAMALIGHMELELQLPRTFSAHDEQGFLHELPLHCEPIFAEGLERALMMYHQGPRGAFKAVCQRSSSLNAVDNALNAGADLKGAVLSGPELLEIPAETYLRGD